MTTVINAKPICWLESNFPEETKKLLADIRSLIFENNKSLIDTIHQRLINLDEKFFEETGVHFVNSDTPVQNISAFTVKHVLFGKGGI